MARLRARLYSTSSSVLAEQWLDQEEPMVRARVASSLAPAREGGTQSLISDLAKRLAGLLLGVLLASCAPTIAPHGIDNDSPALLSDSFLTRDGLRLPVRR